MVIVLKSNLGIYNFANDSIVNIAHSDFLVKADSSVRIDSREVTQVSCDGELILAGNESAALISSSYASVISNGACIIGGASSTAFGQKGQFLGFSYLQKDPFVDPIKGCLDIASLYNPFATTVIKDTQLLALAEPFSKPATIVNLAFKFLKSSDYGASFKTTTDPIPMTIAQQEDLTSGLYGLVNWTEKPVNNTLPFPGMDNFSASFASTGAIPNLQVFEGLDYAGKPDSNNTSMPISAATLNNYKVQPLV